MSQFEELLRNSVFGVAKAFSATEKDLYEEVAAASKAVANVTSGLGTLELKRSDAESGGTTFTLYLVTKKTLYEIAAFDISPNGYPIRVATRQDYVRLGIFEAVLNTRDEINQYLSTAMSTPDSRLVLRVAFLLRQPDAQKHDAA